MLHDLRFLAGYPFGLLAELFAMLAIWVSGNQLDVDFNYLGKKYDDIAESGKTQDNHSTET